MSMQARALGLSLILTLACCVSKGADSIEIVARPPDLSQRFAEGFSVRAAERIQAEIESNGYAALLPDAQGRPESCVLVEVPSGQAHLTVFAWVQQVELTEHAPDGDPRVFGGIELHDADGRQLARSAGTTSTPGEPSNENYAVASPTDPRAMEAADRFGTWILRSIRDFAERVGPYLK